MIYLRKTGRIIDKEMNLLSVFLRKMLLSCLKGLIDTLTDSNTRNNNDKLRPAVMLIQLIHSFDVCIGLADTCFHFDCKIIAVCSAL